MRTLALLALVSLCTFARDQTVDHVATCETPSQSCTPHFAAAAPGTQTWNNDGAECDFHVAACPFRPLSAMRAADRVMSRAGSDASTEQWRPLSAITMQGSGTAKLTWTDPTMYEDGAPAVVVSYHILRGASVATLALLATATTTSYTDSNLAPGTYVYAVTALDAAGNESERSASASKTIAAPKPKKLKKPTALKAAP